MRSYQIKAAKRLLKDKQFALFFEMRLGKTLPVIRALRNIEGNKLVVAENSALFSWEKELEREGQKYVRLTGTKTQRLSALNVAARWFLLNKEGHRAIGEQLLSRKWSAVVLDEATFIKNPRACVTRFFLRGFKNVPFRIILTGTPNAESDLDVVCQMLFLRGSFMGCDNFWKWRAKYCGQYGFKWIVRRDVYPRFKQAVHAFSFSLSRKDAGVKISKPVKEVRMCEMNSAALRLYAEIEKDYEFTLQRNGEVYSTQWATGKNLWLRQVCSGLIPTRIDENGVEHTSRFAFEHKSKELLSLLKGELSGQPVVVWFGFIASLKHAHALLSRDGIRAACIYGDITTEERRKLFNTFGKVYDVLLIQHRCGRVGVDLSISDTAIYYDVPYSLEDYKQSRERIMMPGKTRPVLYVYLTVPDSLDARMVEGLSVKGFKSQRLFNYAVLRRK